MTRVLAYAIAAAGLLLWLAGCVIVGWKATSQGFVDTASGWKVLHDSPQGDSYTVIWNPELAVEMRPRNDGPASFVMLLPVPLPVPGTPARESSRPPFGIALEIRAKSTATVDIGSTVLRVDGQDYRPALVARHPIPLAGHGCISGMLHPEPAVQLGDAVAIPACFHLFFDVDFIPPEKEFSVQVPSIKTLTTVHRVPLVQFRKGTSTAGW